MSDLSPFMVQVLAFLKKRGPRNTHELAAHFNRSPGSMGGTLRILETYGFCANTGTVRIPGKAYSKLWQWIANPPANFKPQRAFVPRKYERIQPLDASQEDQQRKAEINQDNARWFAALRAEQAAKRTQRGHCQDLAAAVLNQREQRA